MSNVKVYLLDCRYFSFELHPIFLFILFTRYTVCTRTTFYINKKSLLDLQLDYSRCTAFPASDRSKKSFVITRCTVVLTNRSLYSLFQDNSHIIYAFDPFHFTCISHVLGKPRICAQNMYFLLRMRHQTLLFPP